MSNEMILKIIDTKIAEYESNPKKTKSTEVMYDLRDAFYTEMHRERREAQERAEYEAHLNRY